MSPVPAREALQAIEQDGDIQSVVVDDTLYTLKNGEKGSRNLQMTALKLVQEITRFRPELDIYILIAQEKEDEVRQQRTGTTHPSTPRRTPPS